MSVQRIYIGGGLRIGTDGSYSSEQFSLDLIHGMLADELVRMDYRRDVIYAFRQARGFPKSVRTDDTMGVLRAHGVRCQALEYELERARKLRDDEALRLVGLGETWRAVAAASGFKNPYIAALKRKARAATPEDGQ